MKTVVIYLIGFSIICGSAYAEVRTWQDKTGRKYEAEFVQELFDKVTLRDTKGKEYRIAVEDLSEHDQKYVRVMVPPEMVINFSKTTDVKPKPAELYDLDNDTTSIIHAKASIAKKSKRPFTSGLHAELFLIAKEVDGKNYILLSKTESSFLFSEQNGNLHEFKADPVEVVVYTEYNGTQRRGEEYLGYLIAVSDSRGHLVGVSTDISWLADKVAELRELYLRGAASVYSRHFDKATIRKVKVPRPDYYAGRR
jgi:hypothetical protein